MFPLTPKTVIYGVNGNMDWLYNKMKGRKTLDM